MNSHTFTHHMAKDRIFRISHCVVLLVLVVLSPMWQNLLTQNFRKLYQVPMTTCRPKIKFQDESSAYDFSVFLTISDILEYPHRGNAFFFWLQFHRHLYQTFVLSGTNLILFRYRYAIALLLSWSKDTVQHLYHLLLQGFQVSCRRKNDT